MGKTLRNLVALGLVTLGVATGCNRKEASFNLKFEVSRDVKYNEGEKRAAEKPVKLPRANLESYLFNLEEMKAGGFSLDPNHPDNPYIFDAINTDSKEFKSAGIIGTGTAWYKMYNDNGTEKEERDIFVKVREFESAQDLSDFVIYNAIPYPIFAKDNVLVSVNLEGEGGKDSDYNGLLAKDEFMALANKFTDRTGAVMKYWGDSPWVREDRVEAMAADKNFNPRVDSPEWDLVPTSEEIEAKKLSQAQVSQSSPSTETSVSNAGNSFKSQLQGIMNEPSGTTNRGGLENYLFQGKELEFLKSHASTIDKTPMIVKTSELGEEGTEYASLGIEEMLISEYVINPIESNSRAIDLALVGWRFKDKKSLESFLNSQKEDMEGRTLFIKDNLLLGIENPSFEDAIGAFSELSTKQGVAYLKVVDDYSKRIGAELRLSGDEAKNKRLKENMYTIVGNPVSLEQKSRTIIDKSQQARETMFGKDNSQPSVVGKSSLVAESAFIEKDKNNNIDIYVSIKGEKKRLTDNPANDAYPVLSPDKKRVLFDSDRDNQKASYVINVDGTGLRKVIDLEYLGQTGKWSEDGTKILYDIWTPEELTARKGMLEVGRKGYHTKYTIDVETGRTEMDNSELNAILKEESESHTK